MHMANKMKHLLVLLLIILKETGPTTACSSSCSLSSCNCRDKGLNSVPQFLPTNIIYLNLYGNDITILRPYDFSRYKALLTLHLAANQISSISSTAFYNLTNLHGLYLFANRLTSLQVHMFEGLDNLEILDLHHNGMTIIEEGTFNSTPKLHTLDLRGNRLTTIAAGTFSNLPQLSSLDLSSNRMNTFPVGLFSNLSTVSNLDIENNQMEILPPEAYDILASISTSNLGSNPWQCDCRMLPFKQRMTGSYLFEYTITCAGPGSFQGKSLLQDVDPEDLICEETTASPSPSTSTPVVQPRASTSLLSTSSKTPSTTNNTVSTSGLSVVSPSSPSVFVENSTSTVQQSSTTLMARVTHIIDSTPSLSTVSTSSSDPPKSSLPSTTPRPTSASTHVQPQMTESKLGPSLFLFSLDSFVSGLLGVAVGTFLICAILLTIRCIHKRRTREAPSSQNSTVSFANTNLPAAVTVGGQVQTGQDRSSIATSTEGYSDVIPSQPGPRQNLYRPDEQGYQIPLPPPLPANGAGSQSAAAHGADAPHHYELLMR